MGQEALRKAKGIRDPRASAALERARVRGKGLKRRAPSLPPDAVMPNARPMSTMEDVPPQIPPALAEVLRKAVGIRDPRAGAALERARMRGRDLPRPAPRVAAAQDAPFPTGAMMPGALPLSTVEGDPRVPFPAAASRGMMPALMPAPGYNPPGPPELPPEVRARVEDRARTRPSGASVASAPPLMGDPSLRFGGMERGVAGLFGDDAPEPVGEGLSIADMSGGMRPQMTTPAEAMLSRRVPGIWGEVGKAIMSGLTESLVPAIVSFAADRRNSPEIVRAWSEQNAMKLQEKEFALKAKIAQQELYGDLLNSQRAWDQLELSRLNARVSILNHARDIMKDAGAKDPLTAIKSIQGLGSAYVAAGGDAEEFAASNPLPSIGILSSLKAQADEAFSRHAGNPAILQAASIPDPFTPGNFLTPYEVYEMTGEVDMGSGRVLIPLGVLRPSDVVERTTRDAEGVERTFRTPMGDGGMGAVDTKYPSLSEGVVTYPGQDSSTGELIINMLRRRPGAVRLPNQVPANTTPVEQFIDMSTRPMLRRAQFRAELLRRGLTGAELDAAVEDAMKAAGY